MATQYTLPDGTKITKPDLADTADITVINTSMQNLANNVTNLNNAIYGGTVPTNTNLNDVVNPAFYLLSMNYTYTNLPPQQIYSMLVCRSSDTANLVVQFGIGTDYIYYRARTSATSWVSWHKLDLYGHGWIEGCDLNDLSSPGTYGLSSGKTYQHLPTGEGSGILEVIAPTSNATYITQRLTIIDRFYIRYKYLSNGASWGSWYKFTGTVVT